VTDHQLFLFLVEVVVLVVAARIGGELAERVGVAQVVGELLFGILLGPTLFGALWPGGFAALFPRDVVQQSLLDIVGWIGVVVLVALAGFEARLGVLRRAGRAVVSCWIGGFAVPFVLGFGLGFVVPAHLVGNGAGRVVFALFLGTAMSISAIPVIGRILLDLGLLGTETGMLILSSALADDTVGWIVLAVLSGIVVHGAVDAAGVLTAVGGTAIFLVGALTAGRVLVPMAVRAGRRLRVAHGQTTVVLAILFGSAALTQAIHIHLVLGAFVAAILVGRSVDLEPSTVESIRGLGLGFFVPFFFAETGLKVDLTTLTGPALAVAVAAVVVACVGKLAGAFGGGVAAGLSRWEAFAVGVGLNARGAMELVIASIGLSIGILTLPMYSTVVLVAVVTTLIAPPMLRMAVARIEASPPGSVSDPPDPTSGPIPVTQPGSG
jgi:Kef-type K+ transport system membrane component KefB